MESNQESVFQTLERIKTNWPEYWNKIVPEVLMFFHIEDELEKSVQEAVQRHAIQRGDFNVLFRLRAGGRDCLLTPTELYTSLNLTSGGLTKILHRLTEKDLIVRVDNPQDRRSNLVQLTAKGEELLCGVMDAVIECDQRFFSVLDQAERNILQNLFKKLLGEGDS